MTELVLWVWPAGNREWSGCDILISLSVLSFLLRLEQLDSYVLAPFCVVPEGLVLNCLSLHLSLTTICASFPIKRISENVRLLEGENHQFSCEAGSLMI